MIKKNIQTVPGRGVIFCHGSHAVSGECAGDSKGGGRRADAGSALRHEPCGWETDGRQRELPSRDAEEFCGRRFFSRQ